MNDVLAASPDRLLPRTDGAARPVSCRAWRRYDGRADCRPLRERRRTVAAPRFDGGRGAAGARAGADAQAGSVLHRRPGDALISTAGFDTDFRRIADADWIIEADCRAARAQARAPGARRCGATSRLDRQLQHVGHPHQRARGGTVRTISDAISLAHTFSIHRGISGCWRSSRRRRPNSAVVAAVVHFADHRLGKGTVIAKDTPNFIANHIALYGVIRTLEALQSGRYTIEEIDTITGPALGRPKSATFRTGDIAGLDILAHVARTLYRPAPGRRSRGVPGAAAAGGHALARMARREDGRGLLPAREERARRIRHPYAGSRDDDLPAEAVRHGSPRSRPPGP